MDFGLYQMKYPARRLIGGMLPMLRDVDPDLISWVILPVGLLTAMSYFWSDHHSWLLLTGAFLILLRMFLATLDGLVAVTFNKASVRGEIVNRVPAEFSDVMLMLAIAQSPHRLGIGAVALGISWLTTFSGLVGATARAPLQSVGPVGQTDRLAALVIFSLVGFIARECGHPIDVLFAFLWWVMIGGSVTIILRLSRTFRAIRQPL